MSVIFKTEGKETCIISDKNNLITQLSNEGVGVNKSESENGIFAELSYIQM
jgi:hypothetical protein